MVVVVVFNYKLPLLDWSISCGQPHKLHCCELLFPATVLIDRSLSFSSLWHWLNPTPHKFRQSAADWQHVL